LLENGLAMHSDFRGNDMATTPDFSVAGKHVLITGGTGGIGGAFAKAFLDHGANVIVADGTSLRTKTLL
jgi:NADP-dependent 3-hydroxy acid dehydrogenase YdfG